MTRTNESNIILAGFMATGKTTVGRAVAQRLERPFIDMDAVLVQRLGAPITEVFATRGEAHFRQAEHDLCLELSTPGGAVVAAGGGAIVNVENRLALARGGMLVCLTVSPQECLRRIGNPASRPMLAGSDPAQRVAALMAERSAVYDAIPRQIDTTSTSVRAIVERVLALYQRDSRDLAVPVRHDSGAYDIVYGDGVLARLGELVAQRGLRGQVAVITNSVVGPLWAERVAHSLRLAGIKPLVMPIPDGEQHKTLATVSGLYDQLAEAGLERGDAVLALGGGVVGDIAGFVAATYLRGVPFVQVPTTVLSMVDSSVGGKVGVDHPRGKNLIGAFKQPALVVADMSTLLSLPAAERRSGLAEAVKHGVITAPDILDHLERETAPDLAWLIPRAVQIKIDVVQEDQYERGRRAELNLGHTFGHALENLSGYRLRHGEGVSIGMVIACRVAAAMGLCAAELPQRVENVLRRLGLPVRHAGHAPEDIWAAMASDKKRKGGKLRFVLPVRVGQMVVTSDAPQALVMQILKETGE
jgi:3-dehydroquinate synthase